MFSFGPSLCVAVHKDGAILISLAESMANLDKLGLASAQDADKIWAGDWRPRLWFVADCKC